MEFAIITSGGKQYQVSVGDYVVIEKLAGEHQIGEDVSFEKVLLVDDGKSSTTIGTPYISGAKVEGKIEKIDRHPKVIVMKYKQKSRYMKKNGHRQPYYGIKITAIK